MEGTPNSDVKSRLLPLMFEMGRLLKREISRDGADMPSYMHIETLRYIQDESNKGENPTMSAIAEYLKIAPPSATALVNTFVKEGILERSPDPVDRRVIRLSLSEKGKATIEKTMRQRAEAFSRVVIAHLSDKDCEELARILSIITRPPNV